MSANSEGDLYNQLSQMKMELVACNKIASKTRINLPFLNKIKLRDIVTMLVHLKQMQQAGVPLLDSLGDLRETSENPAVRDMVSDIYRNVSEGLSLSEAMAHHPKVFSNIFISLVAAGEETGDLEMSFDELIKYTKWVDALRRKIRKAVSYPLIILVVVILAITVMMAFVVPQITSFLTEMGKELPAITIALINTSKFFQSFWWAVIGTPIIMFIGVKIAKKVSHRAAVAIDKVMVSLPVFGGLIRKINVSRFARTFGVLFSSGIDVLRCLSAAQATVTNAYLSETLETVNVMLREGNTLAVGMDATGEFPTMVTRMVRVGEESGKLRDVLDQVAEFYDNDVDESVQNLILFIEPALTAVMGLMIVWIAAAIFGPVYSTIEDIGI